MKLRWKQVRCELISYDLYHIHITLSESVGSANLTHTVPAYFIAVFIYSMPGYQCPIKERMLYSSCKGPLLQIAEEVIGMEIPKKVGPPSISLRLQTPFSRL